MNKKQNLAILVLLYCLYSNLLGMESNALKELDEFLKIQGIEESSHQKEGALLRIMQDLQYDQPFHQETEERTNLDTNDTDVSEFENCLNQQTGSIKEKTVDLTLESNTVYKNKKRKCEQLKNNKLKKHKSKKARKCIVLGCAFVPLNNIQSDAHKNWHADKGYKCTVCPMAFKCRRGLARHKRVHSDAQDMVDESNSTEKLEHEHVQEKLQVKELIMRNYIKTQGCTVVGCTFIPSNSRQIKAHQDWHANKGHKCTVCPVAYSSVTGLACHKNIHCNE